MKVCSWCRFSPSQFRLFALALGISIPILVGGCGGGGSNSGSGSTGSGGGGNTTPAPAITAISPTSVTAGASATTLTVTGSGFINSSVVEVGGAAETTTYGSATQLTAVIPAAQLASGAQLPVLVLNGTVNSVSSINFEVDNPAPTITSISPTSELTGATSLSVTVTGTGFVPTTVINVGGAARTTTFTSSTQVGATLNAADVAAAGTLSLTAVNASPGGGTSAAVNLSVIAPPTTPVITSVSPTSIFTGSGDTTIVVAGNNFTQSSVVQWNGTALPTTDDYGYGPVYLNATVPAADLSTAGSASVTVNTPGASPSLSNSVAVTITNPPVPTLTSIYPAAGPLNTPATITLTGTGFTASTTVAVNGEEISPTSSSSTSITATIPASSVAFPGNVNVTVTTPAPGGGTSSPLSYTAYISIPNNDIAYNATDGLLYASVPSSSVGAGGNSVVGIDPTTGNVVRQIQVGSDPNKLAISTDGTQLFVGLDGAASVAQVNLSTGKVVNQFHLGGGPGVYNPPYTATSLAAVPGSPNSVAVITSDNYVTIYDSGVARTNSASASGAPVFCFGSSASTLYLAAVGAIEALTINSTGVTATTTLSTQNYEQSSIQYDNGRLYLSNGAVIDAATGALLGTFYSSANTAASGPTISDSTLGKAFVGEVQFNEPAFILIFNESTFDSIDSIQVNGVGIGGYPTNFRKIVRWGQNGIALSTIPSAFSTTNQIFIFQSPLVKDLSSSPADLSVALTAPTTSTTGKAISWTATVKNLGPNAAQGAALAMNLDSSLIINSVTPSQGSCGTGTSFTCDLGNMANGASTTVTVNATPTTAGTLAGDSSVTSTSYDPTSTNNQATTITTITGNVYGAVPVVSAISPNLVQAGAADFTLTVTGTGFNENSSVNLNTTALSTTYVSPTQLTASVTSSQIANYGWEAVTVTNPLPGGGVSQIMPLTIYTLVNVPASGLLFDPFAQYVYATVPSTATNLKGNSVVTINPTTGAVGTPIAVGSGPTVMAETSDGNYLYIGLSGSDSLAQFDLIHQSVNNTIPVTFTQGTYTNNVAATSLATVPGSDTTLAIGPANSTWGTWGIFDISGSAGTFRPNLSGIYEGTNPVFANASEVYAYDNQTSGSEFYRYSIDATGLTLIDGTTLDGIGGFLGGFQLVNGLIYGVGGGIANPSTTPPSQIAALGTVDFDQIGISPEAVGVAADPSLQKDFLMEENSAGTLNYALTRYDLTTYLPEALLEMPASIGSSVYAPWTMFRWGQDGLAVLVSTENYSTNQSEVTVMLLRGPFVAPQELEADSAASLTSSSATTITHGSGNTMLTLTGSNFLPGVAVTWNGSYRTTTIVDATHVSVAIPASDLTSTGTASLVATNPGAAASNKLNITIN